MSRREGELSDRDRITAVESRAWGRVVDGETQRGRGEYDLLTTLLQATVSVRESKAVRLIAQLVLLARFPLSRALSALSDKRYVHGRQGQTLQQQRALCRAGQMALQPTGALPSQTAPIPIVRPVNRRRRPGRVRGTQRWQSSQLPTDSGTRPGPPAAMSAGLSAQHPSSSRASATRSG